MIETLTNFGDLAVLLPLASIVTVWLISLRQMRLLVWWAVAVGLCMGSTALLKVYFFVCPPIPALHSPSGHTSFSTLVYGAVTLAVAGAVSGWRRAAIIAAGAAFIATIGISRVLVQAHSVIEVVLGSIIGIAALAVFESRFWPNRPAEPRLRMMLIASVVLMVILNGQDLRAEDMLHAVGLYLHFAGMACF